MSFSKKQSGYSLVEMVIYISILSLFSVTVVNTMLSFSQTYRTLSALRAVDQAGIDSMERMTRDIRSASVVDSGNSTLGSSPGVLTLIATTNGVSTTTKFYIQNNVLKVDVNGTYFGPLSISNASVTNLVFKLLTSSSTSAVKIDMTITATSGPAVKTKSYHDTIVLRGQ